MDKETQSENKLLKEMAPALFEKKIKVDVTPPDGYFDSFPAKISARITSEFPEKGRLRYINFSNLAAAATVALMLALAPVLRNQTSDTPAADALAATSLTTDEAEALMKWWENDDDFDLIEIFGTETGSDFFAELTFEDDVTDRDLENYLISEGVSTEEIAALMSEDI